MALLVRDNIAYSIQFIDLPYSYLPGSFSFLPTHSRMSNFNLTLSEGAGLTLPDSLSNDPVAKAVYDNVMGNIPKKPKVSVFCKVCSLEFSSQVVLDTHLAGSKHQRKLKSKELMKTLEETESGFERNAASGVIRCIVCDVTVNSPQLLATHVAGNKHKTRKGKRANGEAGGPPTKKHCPGAPGQSLEDGKLNSASTGANAKASKATTNGKSSAMTGALLPKKKERPPVSINIPSCVTKLEDTKTGGKFLCNPCQAHCNSDIQLTQHLSSKKHLEKLSGRKQAPPTGTSRGRGWRGGSFGRGRGSGTGRGGSSFSKWGDSLASSANSTALYSAKTNSEFSAYSESPVSANYTADSYGLSSLGRPLSEYGLGLRSSTSRGGSRGSSGPYGRSESYSRSEPAYGSGRVTASFGRGEGYRPEYGAEYVSSRAEEYGRAATEYASQGYGSEYGHSYGSGQSLSHAGGRPMPFTYTQPLSQNFVSSGNIL